jgi:hypothetical protein
MYGAQFQFIIHIKANYLHTFFMAVNTQIKPKLNGKFQKGLLMPDTTLCAS